MTTVATLNAIMRADVAGFVTGMGTAKAAVRGVSAEVTKTSEKLEASGKNLMKHVTLPIVAIAGAAVKMAVDTEQSFDRLENAVGLSKKEVTALKDAAMEMGGDLSIAPKEFGDALFFVASAGFRGAQALDIVAMSAKATAIGMGETKVIAGVVTSAMNAYAKSNLTAEAATDVLIMTMRQGKMEPEELAQTLGKLMPVAAAMDVAFHEVGGAMAVLTRTGFDAAQASTALRAILTAIQKPSKGAEDALQSVGLSAQQLQKVVAEEGLLTGLQLLHGSFEGNTQALFKMFANVRALSGYLAIMGQDGNQVAAVFAHTANAIGVTSTAFKAETETAGYAMRQAWAQSQIAMVAFGDVLLPVAAKIASVISDVAKWLQHLSGPAKTTALVIAGIAAAIGPVLLVGVKFVEMLKNVHGRVVDTVKAVPAMIASLNNMNTAAALTSVGMAAAAAGLAIWVAGTAAAKNTGRQFVEENLAPMNKRLAEGRGTIDNLNRGMEALNGVIASNGKAMDDATLSEKKFKDELTGQNDALRENIGKMEAVKNKAMEMAAITGKNADAYSIWLSTLEDSGASFNTAEEAIRAYNTATLIATGSTERDAEAVASAGDKYAEAKIAMNEATVALQDWEKAVKAQFDPLFGMIDATDKVAKQQQAIAKAQQDIATAQAALTAAQREHGAYSPQAIKANQDLQASHQALKDAQDGMLRTQYDLDIAARKLSESVAAGVTPLQTAKDMVDSWAASGRISAAQAEEWKWKFVALILEADKVSAHQPISLAVDTRGVDNANNKVAHLLVQWAELNKVWNPAGGGGPKIGEEFTGADGKRYVMRGPGPQKLAQGGLLENHQAQVAPAGAMRLWAEPETGGEAYIPLAMAKRSRSMAILRDVAARFGVGLTAMANGGWGAWGAGHTVYEDGSYHGMPAWAKKAHAFAQSMQKQEALLAHPELQGRPGWGALTVDPFAGWDSKADFSNWGKPQQKPFAVERSGSMSGGDAFGGGAGGLPSTVILRVGGTDIVAALVREDHGQL